MKTAGIIFLVFAGLNLFALIAAICTAAGGEIIARELGGVLMCGALGAFLIHRAKQKQQEKEDKEKWNRG